MIETLLGGLLGGSLRLAPELLKWIDRRGERAHELAMQDKALEFERLRGAQRMQEFGAQAEQAWTTGSLAAFKEAIAAQAPRSGVKWADALSSSVRPVITYWLMALYCAAKWVALCEGGVQAAWSEADQALWAGVLNYWFLQRTLEKARP